MENTMNHASTRLTSHPAWAAAAIALLLAAPLSAAFAATGSKPASPEATYQQERQKCLSGRSHQDRATCLQEAGAALAEARRGQLDNGVSERQLMENRLARCKVQPPSERSECERLARGEGKVSGSVESGGVIKELVTRQVGATPSH
jgi:hypothetical protein